MNKANKRVLINLSTILLFLIVLVSAEARERQTYRFGYSSSQNAEILISRMSPMISIMSKALDTNIEFIHKKTFSEMQKAYINQEIDFGIINAYSYLRILPYNSVLPIAARIIENSREYRSYFFSRKDSGIFSIKDLKGMVVALGDPYSTSSYLIPHSIFQKEGIFPDEDFEKTIIISKHDSLILSVLNRTADAGVSASFIFNGQPEEIRSDLRVFSVSDPFLLGPFVANKNLDDQVIATLKEVLFGLKESPEGRAALKSAGFEGFVEVDADAYQPLLEIKESLNLN
ncbi:MAG: hypothetical protein B6241_10745 [Spirochaetaceae bacterium 4572_59]|nr:MAG: hypothetical protein B6241_10745 [Spirochaetaceae bacterium 4572_59]